MSTTKVWVLCSLLAALAVSCSTMTGLFDNQKEFASPEAAAQALIRAVETKDADALGAILGKDWRQLIPIGSIDPDDVKAFLDAWSEGHKIKPDTADRVLLAVGPDDWTLPIPIVRQGANWRFDTPAGAEEIRVRRIGRNELATIQAAMAYTDAQKEYALVDRNGDGVLEYAQKLVSTAGKRDGLYWPVQDGEPESPLGPLFGDNEPGTGYHGYFYRILKGQGPHAPGGAYDYRIGGRMTAGFALIAWPVQYGETGVMTFIVSHAGQVYQKDFGPGTEEVVREITLFDPDDSWEAVSS
jgi:hypothetical protein